eukprot:266579-Amorphochlora_amoeboformis.AAC.1
MLIAVCRGLTSGRKTTYISNAQGREEFGSVRRGRSKKQTRHDASIRRWSLISRTSTRRMTKA